MSFLIVYILLLIYHSLVTKKVALIYGGTPPSLTLPLSLTLHSRSWSGRCRRRKCACNTLVR